ncbi:MAG: hypothetical protein HND54_13735 [Bacteroidetes bacterium]|nr:hypothetical protein [Bacteroidota bacterium]MCB0802095.1 hypothetical protein [Flavobacteriales bacterium]NOG58796.1 hypothetical protein [Bacteroidota bacterium]
MKKIVFLLMGIMLTSMEIKACDLCSIYMNLEPNDLNNSFGFNYRYRTFSASRIDYSVLTTKDKHAIGNTVLSNAVSQEERFNAYDVWLNYFLSNTWQLNASISFSDNYYLENDSIIHSIAGPGDLTLVFKHMVYNTKVTDSSNWAFRLLAGIGGKLPTGKYNQPYVVSPASNQKGNIVYGVPYSELDPHLQSGTGSYDLIMLTEAQLKFKTYGLSSNVSYRINSENSNQFRFANRLNLNSYFFKIIQFGEQKIAPNIGYGFEYSERDTFKGEEYLNSGGFASFFTSGIKYYLKKSGIGITYFMPLTQNLNDKQLQNDKRITCDLTFYF